MKLAHTIEYDIIVGQIVFEPKLFTDNYNCIEVEFEAEPTWKNCGIGSYEYAGRSSCDKATDCATLEESEPPTWDRSKHNDVENSIIKAFTNSDKHEELCEAFCDKFCPAS